MLITQYKKQRDQHDNLEHYTLERTEKTTVKGGLKALRTMQPHMAAKLC